MSTVSEISSRYVDEMAALDPVRGVRMGVLPDATALTDYSPDGVSAMAEMLRRTSTALAGAVAADETERLGRLYLLGAVDAELALIATGEREQQVSILAAPPSSIRLTFDLVPRGTDDDWANVRDRLRNVDAALAGYRATLQAGIDAGRTASQRSAEAVAAQCATWAAGWFGSYIDEHGDGPLRAELDDAARVAGRAYAETSAWMRSTYLPAATEALGVGADRYDRWQESMLGTSFDLDETYAWGWDELARLEAEQAKECDRIVAGGTFAEVREVLDTDPARSIDGVDAYRSWLQDVTDDAIDRLDGWQFDIPDPLRSCVLGIPPEGGSTAPYYTRPSEDGTRSGGAWFPTQGRTRFPMWDQVTTAYHEAVPGHHLQVGLVGSLPLTRAHKLAFQSAHGEGWALYAERLADELGMFATPDHPSRLPVDADVPGRARRRRHRHAHRPAAARWHRVDLRPSRDPARASRGHAHDGRERGAQVHLVAGAGHDVQAR